MGHSAELNFDCTGGRRFRLAILLAHPVQYFSPLFRRLANHPDIDLTVLYCSLDGAKAAKDRGFGVSFAWDIPLLDGYRYKVPKNLSLGSVEGFFGCINPGIVTELKKGNYDAIMVFGWASITNWFTFGAAICCRVPWMLYGDSNSLDEVDLHWLKRRVKKRVLRALFWKTNAFLTSGAFNRQFYELYGASPEKFFDAPWPIDYEFFASKAEQARPRRNEIRAKLGVPLETTVFLFVGKLIERKRPEDLLDALDLLRTTRSNLAVAYVGEGELWHRIQKKIESLRLRNAFLLGFKNQMELPEMYAMADVLAFPSSRDPRGTVTNEAMACGLPVIVSDRIGVWGPGDIVRHGENGFVYPCGNVSVLAQAMQALTEDEGLRQRMGSRSREIVQDYGYDKFLQSAVDALHMLARSRPGRAQYACDKSSSETKSI